MKPNLTINIGLRFDHLMWPDIETDTLKTNYELGTGEFLIGLDSMPPPCNQAGVAPCIPGDGLQDVPFGEFIRLADHNSIGPVPVWDNWQPRFGIAYSMNPTTVLRVGYGLVFDQLTGVTSPGKVPEDGRTTAASLNQQTPSASRYASSTIFGQSSAARYRARSLGATRVGVSIAKSRTLFPTNGM